jgi:hypothetical protein
MQNILAATVNRVLPYPKLINALKKAFTENITVPPVFILILITPKQAEKQHY